MRGADGNTKCLGLVNFENADDAAGAVEALDGQKFDEEQWHAGKRPEKKKRRKSEGEIELKRKFEQSSKEAADKFQGAYIFAKNLDDSIGDEKLKELFSPFGGITPLYFGEHTIQIDTVTAQPHLFFPN